MAGLPHVTRQVTDTSEVIPGLDASTAMFTHVGGTPGTKKKQVITGTLLPAQIYVFEKCGSFFSDPCTGHFFKNFQML